MSLYLNKRKRTEDKRNESNSEESGRSKGEWRGGKGPLGKGPLKPRALVDEKRGHTLNLTSSGETSIAGPVNSETKINYIGW